MMKTWAIYTINSWAGNRRSLRPVAAPMIIAEEIIDRSSRPISQLEPLEPMVTHRVAVEYYAGGVEESRFWETEIAIPESCYLEIEVYDLEQVPDYTDLLDFLSAHIGECIEDLVFWPYDAQLLVGFARGDLVTERLIEDVRRAMTLHNVINSIADTAKGIVNSDFWGTFAPTILAAIPQDWDSDWDVDLIDEEFIRRLTKIIIDQQIESSTDNFYGETIHFAPPIHSTFCSLIKWISTQTDDTYAYPVAWLMSELDIRDNVQLIAEATHKFLLHMGTSVLYESVVKALRAMVTALDVIAPADRPHEVKVAALITIGAMRLRGDKLKQMARQFMQSRVNTWIELSDAPYLAADMLFGSQMKEQELEDLKIALRSVSIFVTPRELIDLVLRGFSPKRWRSVISSGVDPTMPDAVLLASVYKRMRIDTGRTISFHRAVALARLDARIADEYGCRRGLLLNFIAAPLESEEFEEVDLRYSLIRHLIGVKGLDEALQTSRSRHELLEKVRVASEISEFEILTLSIGKKPKRKWVDRWEASKDVEPFVDPEKRFTSKSLTARFLPRTDPRDVWLGEFTNCCQHPGGVGSSCAWHGHEDPDGGFFVIENGRGKIAAQSWVWRSSSSDDLGLDGYCFDNIEVNALGYERVDEIIELYEAAARWLIDEYKADIVTVGEGNSDVDVYRWDYCEDSLVPPHGIYTDAGRQRVIAERVVKDQEDQ